jgi:hypothetical protein
MTLPTCSPLCADHPRASRDQIRLTQRNDAPNRWSLWPGLWGASTAHAHAESLADKNGLRIIVAHEWRLRLRCGPV